MKQSVLPTVCGLLLAIFTQTLIAIAETLSFGPSLAPLIAVFGGFTFPIVTAVTLGIPIGALYYLAAHVTGRPTTLSTALLVSPFVFLQLVSVLSSVLNTYAVFYSSAYILATIGGAFLFLQRAQKQGEKT